MKTKCPCCKAVLTINLDVKSIAIEETKAFAEVQEIQCTRCNDTGSYNGRFCSCPVGQSWVSIGRVP